jgi:hypothetical protein
MLMCNKVSLITNYLHSKCFIYLQFIDYNQAEPFRDAWPRSLFIRHYDRSTDALDLAN